MGFLARQEGSSSTRLLRKIIEDPTSAAMIRSLAPKSLARLINYLGLEDAGEVVALASTEQLLGVFDSDLWRREQGGEEDAFSPERFLLWLEVLLEAGEKTLASRLANLPEDLVISAFYAHVLVLNLDDLSQEEMSRSEEDIDLADKALMDRLGHELDEYYIIARHDNGWDTLLAAILALYEHEPDLLNRILSKCCYASSEYIEENGGLYNVLSAEEMLTSDAAADRADRRATQGFVSPSDAAALFKLAARAEPESLLNATEPDPITRAYFRELDQTPSLNNGEAPRSTDEGSPDVSPFPKERTASKWLPLLQKAGIEDVSFLPALPASKNASDKRGRYQAAVRDLCESDPDGHEHRVRRLIYLANVIEAGLGSSDAPVRPSDAMKAVFDVCDVGLCYVEKNLPSPPADISPVSLFFIGWRILSRQRTIDSAAALQKAVREVLGDASEQPVSDG